MISLPVRAHLGRDVVRGGLVGLAAATTTVAVTTVAILSPRLVRGALATVAVALIAATWLRWPRAGLLVAMAYLPLLALIRRLLIPMDGFTSYDPLLLVVPAATIVVLGRLYVLRRHPLPSSGLAKLVLGLLLITVAEAFNPEGGSLASGVTALLFLAAPLAWFYIGWELVDRQLIESLMVVLLFVATAIALYGLYQTGFGFPDWDRHWIAINGYTALDVGGTIRAFGTFSSGAEYGTYLGMALVVALAFVSRGRFLPVLAVPVLGFALFVESGRQSFVLAIAAVVGVVGLSTGRPRVALLLAFLAVSGAFLLDHFAGQALSQSAMTSDNSLVTHQVGGLADPLNPERSTLTGHVQIALDGLALSLQHPFGLGTAFTTLAGDKLGNAQGGSTEVDFSNAALSLGWIGGLLFGTLVVTSLWRTFRLSLRQRDVATLACSGLLIATFGNWLNGGQYAVAPLVWLVIGWSGRSWDEMQTPRLKVAGKVPAWGKSMRWQVSRWFTTTSRRGAVPSESFSRW